MNYIQRRNVRKLDRYTVAKEIGVSYDFYCDVEKGVRSFNSDQLEKFLSTLKRAKELQLEKINILSAMQKFYELDKNGNSIAKDKLKELHMSQSELASKMNVTPPVICNLLKDFTKVFYETSYRVYDYLNGYNQEPKLDITSIQDKEEKTIEISGTIADIKDEIDKEVSMPVGGVVKDNDLFIGNYSTTISNLKSVPSNGKTTRNTSENMRIEMLEFEISMLKQKLEMISKIINM